MKKVLGNRVLVEQIMTKKESSLILTKEQKQDTDNFHMERKIIMLGDEVAKGRLEIGDIPIFGKYAVEESIKIVEKIDTKTEYKMIAHIIMHVENIVGLDEIELK